MIVPIESLKAEAAALVAAGRAADEVVAAMAAAYELDAEELARLLASSIGAKAAQVATC